MPPVGGDGIRNRQTRLKVDSGNQGGDTSGTDSRACRLRTTSCSQRTILDEYCGTALAGAKPLVLADASAEFRFEYIYLSPSKEKTQLKEPQAVY